jgi:hypothetical protein
VQEQGQGDASTLAIGGLLSGVSTNQGGLYFFSYGCNTCKIKTRRENLLEDDYAVWLSSYLI